ncbi:hypothetical protein PAUR_a1668 [Pseudoalteromonas aurantia 208]|uniref:Orphan protein n=1 Tax=Pseudoalteromonas aurantia 208 TaxID=1314867 RepID=A0ABR9ECQ8_9GAMM|nr:hypothetical protein [Pseudoalteromonas aurantia 208]
MGSHFDLINQALLLARANSIASSAKMTTPIGQKYYTAFQHHRRFTL